MRERFSSRIRVHRKFNEGRKQKVTSQVTRQFLYLTQSQFSHTSIPRSRIKYTENEIKLLVEQIYEKLQLTSLEDWINVSAYKFRIHGGYWLLKKGFNLDFQLFLRSYYPNYPWDFTTRKKVVWKVDYENNIEEQQQFLETLFKNLNLQTFEDWRNVTKTHFIENRGYSLLACYQFDIHSLLKSIYPNYPWVLRTKLSRHGVKYFEKKRNQIAFLDEIFWKLDLKTFEGWKTITAQEITKLGGKFLLKEYYENNFQLLLTSLYPNYPFDFVEITSTTQINGQNAKEYLQGSKYYAPSLSVDNYNQIINQLTDIEAQRQLMETFYNTFRLTSFSDWLKVPKYYFLRSLKGLILYNIYSSDYFRLLSTIYPNFPWSSPLDDPQIYFRSMENQIAFMDQIRRKLNFYSLDMFSNLKKNRFLLVSQKIHKNAGKYLLSLYSYDWNYLLCSIYPNHKWIFSYSDKYLSLINQQSFMDNLYIQLKLDGLESFQQITPSLIIQNKGKSLLAFYRYDLSKLFESLYPNYPWNFKPIDYSSLTYQRSLMNMIYHQLNLQTIDDFLTVSNQDLILNGAKAILDQYDDINQMISTLYPNHILNIRLTSKTVDSIAVRREFIDTLYNKFHFSTLNDWLYITRNRIRYSGGGLLLDYYNNDYEHLLVDLYPYYPWNFFQLKIRKNRHLYSIENQRKIMAQIFTTLKLKRLDDWMKVAMYRFKECGGAKLLAKFYNNDFPLLLRTIYPNHTWNFSQSTSLRLLFQSSNEYQRSWMDKLYVTLELNSMEEWKNVTSYMLIKHRGGPLLTLYSQNINLLLQSIYPEYPWNFEEDKLITSTMPNEVNNDDSDITPIRSTRKLLILKSQRRYMSKLYRKLKLKSLDDWVNVSRTKLGGKKSRALLAYYSYDYKRLLRTIYPNHTWNFSRMRFYPDRENYRDHLKSILNSLRILYQVRQKKDWYRIQRRVLDYQLLIPLPDALRQYYPDDHWPRKLFIYKSKKSNQRLLFGLIQQYYQTSLVLENYHHPHFQNPERGHLLEFDLFIPALNLALEYQGEHHYNEISAFYNIESLTVRDRYKEEITTRRNVNLICIPFWWDRSLSTLVVTMQSHIKYT